MCVPRPLRRDYLVPLVGRMEAQEWRADPVLQVLRQMLGLVIEPGMTDLVEVGRSAHRFHSASSPPR